MFQNLITEMLYTSENLLKILSLPRKMGESYGMQIIIVAFKKRNLVQHHLTKTTTLKRNLFPFLLSYTSC
jgi:hypothetical protein